MADINDTVSIIVPVYNAEKFLADCISSIIQQTYQNIDVVLIDDGSTDQSGTICDDFCRKDFRIHVFHQKNNGVSSARNIGIEKAIGKYVFFIDADDMLTNDCIEVLVNDFEATNTDIVIGSYYKLYGKRKLYRHYNISQRIISSESFLDKMIDDGTLSGMSVGSVCGILYKKEVIIKNTIRFQPDIKVNEDGLFNLSYFTNINTITYEKKALYYYRQWKKARQVSLNVLKTNFEKCEEAIQTNSALMSIDNIQTQLTRRNLTIIWFLSLQLVWNSKTCPKEDLLNLWSEVDYCSSAQLLNYSSIGFYKKYLWKLVCNKHPVLFFCLIRYLYPILASIIKR